jgi:hypothetical protein
MDSSLAAPSKPHKPHLAGSMQFRNQCGSSRTMPRSERADTFATQTKPESRGFLGESWNRGCLGQGRILILTSQPCDIGVVFC